MDITRGGSVILCHGIMRVWDAMAPGGNVGGGVVWYVLVRDGLEPYSIVRYGVVLYEYYIGCYLTGR